MKKIILVLLFSIPVLFNAQALTKQENIKVLFQLMQTDSVVEKMMNSMIPMMMKSVPQQDSTANSQMTAMMNKMTHVMMVITKRLLNEDMIVLYDKYYTESEIKDLVTFYKSPAGQKMITVMADLNKEMMMIFITKYVPEIQQMLKD